MTSTLEKKNTHTQNTQKQMLFSPSNFTYFWTTDVANSVHVYT